MLLPWLILWLQLTAAPVPPELELVLDWKPPEQPPLSVAEMEAKCTEVLELIAVDDKKLRAQVLLRRGTLRQFLPDRTKARPDILEAHLLDPEDLDIWYADAASAYLFDGNNVERMESEAAKMIATRPAAPHGYRLAAQVELRLRNDPAAGIRYMKRVIEIGGASRRDHCDLARCYARQERWSEALGETDAAILLPPTYPVDDGEIHEVRGVALDMLGQHRAALAHLQRAYLIDPKSEFLRQNLWNCYARLEMFGSCLRISAEQVKLFPEISRPHAQLGLAEAHFGSNDAALAHCLKAVELDPKSWFTWHYLGRVQLRAGDHVEAMKSWQKAAGLSASLPIVASSGQQNLDRKAQRLANDLRIAFLQAISSIQDIRDPKAAIRTCRTMLQDPEVMSREPVRMVLACALAADGNFESALGQLNDVLREPGTDESVQKAAKSLQSLFQGERPYEVGLRQAEISYEIPLFFGISLRQGEIDLALP